MLYHILVSPQMKRTAIISDQHGILGSLEKLGKIKTCSNYELVLSLPTKMEILLILAKSS